MHRTLTHDNNATVSASSLPYRLFGPRGATPLLTLHGLASSTHHWRSFTPYFSRERPVVSWDYRGHAGQPGGRVDVASCARDAVAVWRATELAPAVAVGLSFGVQVALELWRQDPSAVRALILICGTAGHPLDRVSSSPRLRRAAIGLVRRFAGRRDAAARLLGVMGSPRGRWIARELAYATGGAHRDACPAELLDGVFGHIAALDPVVIAEMIESYLEHDATDVLQTITVPTLIIAGDRDQLTPVATAEAMQRAIPNSELVVFAGHSHLVQVERPDEVHALIDRFLARHAF